MKKHNNPMSWVKPSKEKDRTIRPKPSNHDEMYKQNEKNLKNGKWVNEEI